MSSYARPTIGRIVHYWHNIGGTLRTDTGYKQVQEELKCFPAIITDVRTRSGRDAEMKPVEVVEVSLHIFGAVSGPGSYDATIPYSETPQAGHWCWPPKGSPFEVLS